ncbi:MAG: hypothetical protein DME87_04665 [Verrucomicrobia bacterium]|nr:MAG: hypothetical protein DME87_04665 [Verrucomicrobiota bacterium]
MPQSVKFSLEMRFVQLVFFCALAICGGSAKEDEGVSAGTVIREINIAQKRKRIPLFTRHMFENCVRATMAAPSFFQEE